MPWLPNLHSPPQGQPLAEDFRAVSGLGAVAAFGVLLKGLMPLAADLASDTHGVHVLVRAVNLAAPSEVVAMGQHILPAVRARGGAGSGGGACGCWG